MIIPECDRTTKRPTPLSAHQPRNQNTPSPVLFFVVMDLAVVHHDA